MNPTLQTIHSRKSVRQYTGQPVERDILTTIMQAGMAAPCSRGQCCWSFIAVDDSAMIEKLNNGLPYAKMLETAKHAIIVLADLNLAHGGTEAPYWIQDCSATAENILLAAESLGLGACWTAAHPRPERVEFLKTTLELPDHIIPLCVIAIGHPKDAPKPKNKIDNSKIFWNKWGQK
ncbi:MAG: nitroreductase family protein [Candidatus Omnitrophica bacterium]|nr:nitroreductase family protein [Candidatus Omnitrophota bacterium]